MRIKIRKIKFRFEKFFGHPEDNWARLGGRRGKKRSYGHFRGFADGQSRAEKANTQDRKELRDGAIAD